MDNSNNIAEHQSVNELRKRIRECKATLLNLLNDWHYLQNVLQPRLMFIYESYFGDLEYELQNKTRLTAEIERRIELLYYKINKGEKITQKTIELIDNIVNKEFSRYYGNNSVNQSSNSNKSIENDAINEIINDLDLSYIYRQLVKRLHPDLNGVTEDFNKYWDIIQESYKSNDAYRLRMFFKTLCLDENNFIDSNLNEELNLRKEVKELELNIAIEQRKIDRLKKQEPFVFEDKLNDFNWIERRQQLLKDKIFHLDRKLKQNENILKSLTSLPTLNKSNNYNNFNNQFQQSFFSASYSI